jgi:DNA-binding transcriptional regulator LsrR (DeoR family)
MKDIIININGTVGRPSGSTRSATIKRNAMIVKAYNMGFRRKVIADMMGLSYQTVCHAIKEARNA